MDNNDFNNDYMRRLNFKEKKFGYTYNGNNYNIVLRYNPSNENLEGIIATKLDHNFQNVFEDKDTTELSLEKILSQNKTDQQLVKAKIAHYSSDWAITIDENGNRSVDREILLEIDVNALKHDGDYAMFLLTKVLDERRIDEILMEGMQDNPHKKRGMYVGAARRNEDNNLTIAYDDEIGRSSHDSNYMKNLRFESKRKDYKGDYYAVQNILKQMGILQDRMDRIIKKYGGIDGFEKLKGLYGIESQNDSINR